MPSRRISFLLAAALVLLAPLRGSLAGSLWAQAPIKIGEINSYSGIGAPFTGPTGWRGDGRRRDQARGGVLGRSSR